MRSYCIVYDVRVAFTGSDQTNPLTDNIVLASFITRDVAFIDDGSHPQQGCAIYLI